MPPALLFAVAVQKESRAQGQTTDLCVPLYPLSYLQDLGLDSASCIQGKHMLPLSHTSNPSLVVPSTTPDCSLCLLISDTV